MVCILDLVPESLLDMQTIICDQASLLPVLKEKCICTWQIEGDCFGLVGSCVEMNMKPVPICLAMQIQLMSMGIES